MKIWFSSKKSESDKAARVKLSEKELSDDLMAQITGGAAKTGCHTARLA